MTYLFTRTNNRGVDRWFREIDGGNSLPAIAMCGSRFRRRVLGVLSFLRWMPACFYPFSAHHLSNQVVDVECHDCRTSTGGTPDDVNPIFTPPKVSCPTLLTWVKQPHPPPCQWVTSMRLCAFVMVAEPTCQPKIILIISATPRRWDDVVNLQKPQHIFLTAEAVATSVSSLMPYPFLYVVRDMGAHGDNGSRNPLRTASTSASACRSKFAS